MAQPWVTGPVSVWVRRAGEGTPQFLGHGERAPQPNFNPAFNDVICDISGSLPLDRVYSGENAQISVDLIRWNMPVYSAIRTRARSATFPTAVPGTDQPGMIGTLAIAEGAAYELWLLFGSALKPTMNPGGVNGVLGAGYHFLAAMMDPESHTFGSANAYKIHLSWSCYRIFIPVQTAFGFGAFRCWDQDMSAVLGLPLN